MNIVLLYVLYKINKFINNFGVFCKLLNRYLYFKSDYSIFLIYYLILFKFFKSKRYKCINKLRFLYVFV